MKLKDFLREYREAHGLSQRQFAEQCGFSNGYISMLERGYNPKTKEPIACSIKTLNKLAAGMGITLNSLLLNVDDMPVVLEGDDEIKVSVPLAENGRTDPVDVELYDIISELPRDKKIDALKYLRYLAGR